MPGKAPIQEIVGLSRPLIVLSGAALFSMIGGSSTARDPLMCYYASAESSTVGQVECATRGPEGINALCQIR